MSTMPTSQSLNHIMSVPPPPPVSMDTRAESRSPSMIPRKTSGTPSSARTTPDINRKSYSSGLSVGSNMSFNTVRTSVGSSQPRISQSSSASRLPAPKHATVHNPPAAEETEEVPPVPAIPKAYESPKGSPAEIVVLERKKSGLSGLDTRSIQSSSAASMSMPVHPEPSKLHSKPSTRKSSYMPPTGVNDEKPATPSQKKSLQPLSLPPISLGPLNIPSVGKDSWYPDSSEVGDDSSPPPSRLLPKTPSTPMTASRSAFFSKTRYDDTMEMPSLRSSSTVHGTHRLTPTPDASSTDSSLGIKEIDQKPSISPFLSSSAPKGGFEHSFLKRSKTGGDDPNMTAPVLGDHLHQKPAGPRALKTDKPIPKSPTPGPNDEPATPSSMSSLRRKLSLTWKRGSSKNSSNAAAEPSEKPAMPQQQFHPPARQDSMPPPRIPVSATVNNLSSAKQQASPSPPVKQNGGYLESRRRKSSAASLGTFVSHDRTKSDTWGSKKDTPDLSTMPTTRNTSVMHKFLKPKGSSSAMRNGDSWSADLDKDDVAAEEEMKKMGSRRKETEIAARTIDALRKRATPKERVGPHEAIRIAILNIYERGEIIDYNDVYFCGTQNAHKVVGDLQSDAPNFGYDDERGDYTIVPGDHLAYRYEIVDVLGKGSFGQVVRCIDHKLGVLVAVKIIRNKKRFHQQALVEVNILQKLREWVSSSPSLILLVVNTDSIEGSA
jgi:dual specificity tyrosine-phosphorylation-regulated kinase 2/3/4